MKSNSFRLVMVVVGLVLWRAAGKAEILVYEPFTYDPGPAAAQDKNGDVDPLPEGPGPGSGVIKTNIDVGTVTGLTILSSGDFSLDELRIGETYADVFRPPPLVITGQPQDHPARVGDEAEFRVAAFDPEGLSYQWRFDGTNVIAGATNSSYTLRPVQEGDVGAYSVVVQSGFLSITSQAASLYLVGPTLVVMNTNDAGLGSLRRAISDANSLAGPDVIEFDIDGPGPYVIRPASDLPEVTDPVTIDGTTQPGFSGQPVVELSGRFSGRAAFGLRISSGQSRVRGLVINGFPTAALGLFGRGSNLVVGNFFGTDRAGLNAAGTDALGNQEAGVSLMGDIAAPTIGNVIGGLEPGSGNVISANFMAQARLTWEAMLAPVEMSFPATAAMAC